MRKVIYLLGIILLIPGVVHSAPSDAIGMQPGQVVNPWTAQSLSAPLTSQSYSVAIGSKGVPSIVWQTTFPSAPSSITVNLQGSMDGTTYVTVDSSTSTTGAIRTVFGSYKFIRFYVSATSGGSSPTISIIASYSLGGILTTLSNPGIMSWGQDITWTGNYPSLASRVFQTQVGQTPTSFQSSIQGYLQISNNLFASLNQGPRNDPPIVGNGTLAALSGINQSDDLFEVVGTLGVSAQTTDNASQTANYSVGIDGEAFYFGMGTMNHIHGVYGYGFNAAGNTSSVGIVSGGTFQAYSKPVTGGVTTNMFGVTTNAKSLNDNVAFGGDFYAAKDPITEDPGGAGTVTKWASVYIEDARSKGTSSSYSILSDGGDVVLNNGSLAVNASAVHASAVLSADSTTQGFLPPAMTTTQRDAISTPAEGLIIANTTTHAANYYNGTSWGAIGSGGGDYHCTTVTTLNSAAVNALTTTAGTTLVAGQAGHFYKPMLLAVTKTAGTAYTINSSAKISLGHIGVSYYFGIVSTGLMDQTTLTKKYADTAFIQGTGPDNTAAYDGAALGIMVNTGSFTGSGSDIKVTACYVDVLIP